MRRKLWLLVILFLFLVGRESCCASQEQVAPMNKINDNSEKSRKEYHFVYYISRSLIYISRIGILIFIKRRKGGILVNSIMLLDTERNFFTIGFT